jgi:hypothetical protein
MGSSYVVYIDESGDEGFDFEKGSTQWFVLSAIVIEKSLDLKVVKLVDEVRALLQRKDKEPLHFRKLKHEHRLPLVDAIARSNLKAITILVHKPSITNIENFQQKYRLYFYATRLLLERVSWYCRERQPHVKGDGGAQIVFSNRSSMNYESLRTYFKKLQEQPFDIQIDWDVIKTARIHAYPSEKRMGLQLADAIASGFFYGVNVTRYGFTEHRYVEMLKPVIYSHKGRFEGYGVKLFPTEAHEFVKQSSHVQWLSGLYGVS